MRDRWFVLNVPLGLLVHVFHQFLDREGSVSGRSGDVPHLVLHELSLVLFFDFRKRGGGSDDIRDRVEAKGDKDLVRL